MDISNLKYVVEMVLLWQVMVYDRGGERQS
jgi:hypothetical protein